MHKVFILLLLLLPFCISAQMWKTKVDPDLLLNLNSNDEIEFIIKFKSDIDFSSLKSNLTKDEKAMYVFLALSQKAKISQRNIIEFLYQENVRYHSLNIVNVIKTKGSIEMIEWIASQKEVENIQSNPYLKFEGNLRSESDNSRAVEWGIQKINADSVWSLGYKGENVTIGGQDTGYEWQHPALKSKYRGLDEETDEVNHNYNWHDAIHEINPLHNDSIVDPSNNPCGLDSPYPCDDNNHGTHTMGTMLGSADDLEIGVAPNSKWCACRNMERGWGTPFTYLECFEWFLAPTDLNNENPDPSKAPHVIANSWSCPEIEGCNPMNFELLNEAVNNLTAAGTVVVVSAGNSGDACSSINTPAAIFQNSFTVGATNINDTIATFSSRGPITVDSSGRLKPNIVAPGVNVNSSIRFEQYASYSGTSMAGPHVAGVVALIISARPELAGQVDVIREIIESTAVPLITTQECDGISGETIPNHTYGYGRIDALAAVEMALEVVLEAHETELKDIEISVYPNPAFDRIQLQTKGIEGNFTFQVYSIDGVQLMSLDLISLGVSHTINIESLSPGLYIGEIVSEQGDKSMKFIKQ